MTGFILLNKPEGITSFQAAAKIRRIYGEKRIGHTGTLDPMATGVLPLLLGRSTRLCSFVVDADKRYTARLRLGTTTDTLDITGTVLTECEVHATEADFLKASNSFVGEILQVPPMYSAIRSGGKRLYELAREGVEIERKPRKVTIKSLDVIKVLPNNEYEINVLCSKGTYIRSLCDDIGKALGCGAVLTSLCRTETAGFKLANCLTLEEIEKGPAAALMSADLAVPQFPKVFITEKQKERFMHGAALSVSRLTLPQDTAEHYKVFCGEEFLGLGLLDTESGELKVKCITTD